MGKLTAVVADSEETEEAAAAGKKTEATTTTTSKTKTLSWDEEEAAAQLSVAAKSKALFPVKNGKVNVYIVAEAFCPNCKEHSYYMDKLLMTPQGEKSGVRNIMNIYMEQMVLEGWDSEDDTGICEKGKYDCELSKYNLCSETIGNSVDNNDQHMWWDFVRCNYKHQDLRSGVRRGLRVHLHLREGTAGHGAAEGLVQAGILHEHARLDIRSGPEVCDA